MANKKARKKGTMIHGIGASEHLDSSGERIEIEGIDISSLTVDGVFNYEHKSNDSTQIVGKITVAKKIFKRSDCDNDYQRYFWDKIKTPYLYVAGELFDAQGHTGAKDVAAMLKYDDDTKDERGEDERKLINFSIEGQKLEKRGSLIKKCIARKVSITITPCNKMCEAEELSPMEKSDKFTVVRNYMELEKGERVSSCQLLKTMGDYKPKRTFTTETAPANVRTGDRIVNTRTGTKTGKTGAEIYGKPPKYSADNRKISSGTPPPPAAPKINNVTPIKPIKSKLGQVIIKNSKRKAIVDNLQKTLTAGSNVGAPGTITGGAALVKEDLSSKTQAVCEPVVNLKKEKKKKTNNLQKSNPFSRFKDFTVRSRRIKNKNGSGLYISAHHPTEKDISGGPLEIANLYVGDDTDNSVWVDPRFRRQGIATNLYQYGEHKMKGVIKPSGSLSQDGKKLWEQPNRPFGNEKSKKIIKSEADLILKFVQDKYPQLTKAAQVAVAKTVAVLRKQNGKKRK